MTVPTNHTDASAPSDCHCNPGYAHCQEDKLNTSASVYDNECHACSQGFYNEELNSTQCSLCWPRLFSTINVSVSADNCARCPSDTYTGSGKAECSPRRLPRGQRGSW